MKLGVCCLHVIPYFYLKKTFDYLKITLISVDKHIKIFFYVIVLSNSDVHVFKIALV